LIDESIWNLIAFKDIRWKNCTTLVLRQL